MQFSDFPPGVTCGLLLNPSKARQRSVSWIASTNLPKCAHKCVLISEIYLVRLFLPQNKLFFRAENDVMRYFFSIDKKIHREKNTQKLYKIYEVMLKHFFLQSNSYQKIFTQAWIPVQSLYSQWHLLIRYIRRNTKCNCYDFFLLNSLFLFKILLNTPLCMPVTGNTHLFPTA